MSKQSGSNVKIEVVIFFLYKILLPYYKLFFVVITLAILWAVDFSLRPYILKIILNKIADNSENSISNYLIIPISIYLLLAFFSSTSARLYSYAFEIRIVPLLRQDIVKFVFNTLLKQNSDYYQNNFSGSITNRVNELSNCIPEITQIIIDRLFRHSLAIIIATYTLWQVNSKFALVMLAWIIIFLTVSLLSFNKTIRLVDIWANLTTNVNGRLMDIILNILSVQLFTRQNNERSYLNRILAKTVLAEQRLLWSYFWICFLYGYAFVIVQALNIYFLITYKQQGLVSVGDFVLVLTINIAIVNFLQEVMNDFSQFSRLLGKIKQALQVLNFNSTTLDIESDKDLHVTKGCIVFHKVSFCYPNNKKIFQNQSLIINSGEKVGIVGYSGSGKTTFIKLILRLFDVSAGKILIDDQDISRVNLNSLRKNITLIPQDIILFNRTLMDNIRYGNSKASDEEVIIAAKLAHAHEFITELPEGYFSFIGERGTKLSGGQRQRIAIARAILKNSPIIIFDEATNQLDSLVECKIQESLNHIMIDKTIIFIAHRLTTLINLDNIFVLDNGNIIQSGKHNELIREKGVYKKLWDTQEKGFLPSKNHKT